ncbi:MAG: SLBB domain-containing protein, partial [Bacteroidota bacterium]
LRPGARQDVAFLFRTNDDGTERLERVELGADAGAGNVPLRRGDRLRVLSSSSFVDRSTFTVEGAVRSESVTLPFPADGAVTLEEAILLAGGLATNAASEVVLIRQPLDNTQEREYQRVNLNLAGTTTLRPFDRIVVYDNERFSDQRLVRISGAVRQPGSFTYDPSLQLQDLLYLAGGTRIDAARDRVEVFRLQFTDGAETKTLLTTLDLDNVGDFRLQPFDEIVVRSAAEFETIRKVVVQGEVRYPGSYALLDDNERLSDLVRRAGGLTAEAFPEAATLFRPDNNQGYVVLDLDEAVADPTDISNMVLLTNDTLTVPKRRDLVTIYTRGTLADRFGGDSTTVDGTIKVAYQGKKSAQWYIENYAGGFDPKRARRSWTTVEYANGQVVETGAFLLTKRYPEVLPGASVRAGIKPERRRRSPEERTNWGEIAQATTAGVTTLLTLALLVNQLGN